MRRSGIVLGIVLGCSSVVAGATAAASAAEPDLPYLLQLRGELVEVRYSPGALDRAAHVQQRFELLAGLLADLAHRPVRLTVWVVDPEDWKRGGFTRPFGLPQTMGEWGVALPAWGDDQSVALWRDLLGGALPPTGGSPVRGSGAEAASLGLADVAAQVDVVRLAFSSFGYSAEPPWATEVAVHAAARLAFSRFEAGRMEEIDSVFARLAARGGGDGAHPLAGFDPLAPAPVKLWYEAQFARGARLLFDAERDRQIRRLLLHGLRKGAVASGAELEKRAPALVDWQRVAFAP